MFDHAKRTEIGFLPDRERSQSKLGVLEEASDEHEYLEVPGLEAEHDGGCERELQESAEAREGLPREPGPHEAAPAAGSDDVDELRDDDDPPADAEGERGPEEASPNWWTTR